MGDTEQLPPGWERRTTKDGKTFYIDHNTRTTSWVMLTNHLLSLSQCITLTQTLPKKSAKTQPKKNPQTIPSKSSQRTDSVTKMESMQAEVQVCGKLCSAKLPCNEHVPLGSIYHAWEIFGRKKFWRTVQVKAIGEEKFGNSATVSSYAKYTFGVSVNIGKENFGELLTICQIHQFFPLPNVSCVVCTVLEAADTKDSYHVDCLFTVGCLGRQPSARLGSKTHQ